jgi:predicted lactoylglutathione lyase
MTTGATLEAGPQFEGLNLVANDVDATANFYRRLGVEIGEDKIWRTSTGAHHTEGVALGPGAEVEIDSQALAPIYNAGSSEASDTVIGFRLASREAVDAIYDELTTAGYDGRQEPYDAFWGARYAIVADSDGRDVGLMSPSDAAFRSDPPQI